MNRIYCVIASIGLFATSLFAQQVNIVGKVRDTSGTPLEGVVASLAAHPIIADTTNKDGLFALVGKLSGVIAPKAVGIHPFTKFIGNTVYFAVNEPTFVLIEIFNSLGKHLAKPLNGVVSAGTFHMPLATDLGRQLLLVRVSRGNDVKVFRMQNLNSPRKATGGGVNGAFSASSNQIASLSKVVATPAIDTLVFSRRGSLTQRMPITSYAPSDSIKMSLHVITDPYLFCYALNLAPMDTVTTQHYRNDTTYLLSVIAFNTGGGNAYSSEVYVSSSDSDVVISSSRSSLSNVQAGSVKTGTPISFIMKKRLAAGRNVQLNFHFKDSWSGTTREWFDTLNWAPKPFLYEGAVLDDDNIAPTIGNGNGKVEPGEKIGLAPVIKNMSNGMIAPINGRILSTFSGLDTLTKNNFFPWMNDTLAPGKDGTVDSEFVSVVSSSMKIIYGVAPCIKDSIRYDVLVSGAYAKGNCQWILPVYCAAKIADTARILTITKVRCNVSISPNNAYYLTGDSVRLIATPNTGYHFVDWTGDTNSTISNIKIFMNNSKSMTATCVIDSFPLRIHATNGTVTKNPDKPLYVYGDTVLLTAVPGTASRFFNWSGALTGSNNPAKLFITADSAVTANFSSPCTLTVNATNGTVTKTPDKPQYTNGDTVTLTAVPAFGRFLSWSGAVTGSTNPAKLVIYNNSIVTANFNSPCTLTINAVNGTVSKNPDKLQYSYGDTVTLTGVPANNSKFLSWGGAVTGNNNPAKLVIVANASVTANFTPPCTLNVIGINGSVSKDPDKLQYTNGDTVTLTATPAAGYCFRNWSGAMNVTDNPAKLVMTSTLTLTANYVLSTAAVSAGWFHTMILRHDGSLWATGLNDSGQLGDGSTVKKSSPVQIMIDVSAVSAGGYHTMILKSDGSLWATGLNDSGQLGDGTTIKKIVPIQIMTNVLGVSAGKYHTMILKSDSSLWATGLNHAGQLGDGSTTNKSTPIQIMTHVLAVSAGGYHTMILKNDGSLWATGLNGSGQLGDGTGANKSTPIQIMTNVSAVSAGEYHTMILKNDGSLWAMGRNNNVGALGDGTILDRGSPVQIMTDVSAVSAGGTQTMIIKKDGSLWAAGKDFYGELGDGGSASSRRVTPFQIMTNVSAVSAGNQHTMILKNDGLLWATGNNTYGELGDGTTVNTSTPVLAQ